MVPSDAPRADAPDTMVDPKDNSANTSKPNPADDATIATRGDLDGKDGEDVYLVNQPSGQQLVGTRSVKPFLAAGGGLFGDLDGSGTVDSGDIALALLDFGPCPGCAADLDQSGIVDFGDVALILLSYG